MDESETERKVLLQIHEDHSMLQTVDKLGHPSVDVNMPAVFTDGDQGPLNQVILSTIGAATDEQSTVLDGSVSGTFVADASTLQNLIASGTVQLTDASGQPLQLVKLPSSDQCSQTTASTVMPASTSIMIKGENMIAVDTETSEAESRLMAQLSEVPLNVTPNGLDLSVINNPAGLVQNLPPGTPVWAARLRDCQKIGDFYRGWVETEVELDIILTVHKQQTHSMWGTRQSPCPNKPATRLMWKSQYVQFDGMPFLNAGSRAIVMECQFGPRRKGSQSRKDELAPLKSDFKQTCPARIYIKKVRKFIDYQISVVSDKKQMKIEMDRAFQAIREKDYKLPTQERYYVQLPTEKAHEYHLDHEEEVLKAVMTGTPQDESICRLHPLVSDKIRDMVSMGETRLYAIRKQLRKFVEKEIFEVADNVPDKHNLQFFPTVNDLQNHIHQAARDIESGVLPVAANTINLEMMEAPGQSQVWQMAGSPHAETVTVTITQPPGGENHVISKVETHLSDGSTQVTENLNPETARLLAKLHPNMFSSFAPNQEESTTIRLQMPAAAGTTTTESLLSVPSESTSLLTPPTVPATDTVAFPEDDHSAYTVIQGSNGSLFLTKATGGGAVLAAEEECMSTGNILSQASMNIPASSVRDMDHSGVLTIVENIDSSANLSDDSAVNIHSTKLSQTCSTTNTRSADSLSGDCSFTVPDSAFQPVVHETAVGFSSDSAVTTTELEVVHLSEAAEDVGMHMLVSQEQVGMVTQTGEGICHSEGDEAVNVMDYGIVKANPDSVEVVL